MSNVGVSTMLATFAFDVSKAATADDRHAAGCGHIGIRIADSGRVAVIKLGLRDRAALKRRNARDARAADVEILLTPEAGLVLQEQFEQRRGAERGADTA